GLRAKGIVHRVKRDGGEGAQA
ncbi:MAG: hypothetical protein QOF61_836, partial [Acidobacteriota bacterium]|nr:hypothetical protein [Acidobacteriota bacterium]